MGVLLLVGLLMLWLRSLRGATTSTTLRVAIDSTFKRYGYSERMANYWMAIAKVESANLTSSLFTKYNNPFGMSYPTIGRDYGKVTLKDAGTSHDFSVYPSVQDAVDDLIEYLSGFGYKKDYETPDELVEYMKAKGYYSPTAAIYLKAVKVYL